MEKHVVFRVDILFSSAEVMSSTDGRGLTTERWTVFRATFLEVVRYSVVFSSTLTIFRGNNNENSQSSRSYELQQDLHHSDTV